MIKHYISLVTFLFSMVQIVMAQDCGVTITTASTCNSPELAPTEITGNTTNPGARVAIYVDGSFQTYLNSDAVTGDWSWSVSGSILTNSGTHTVEAYNLDCSYIANGDANFANSLNFINTSTLPAPTSWAYSTSVTGAQGGVQISGSVSNLKATTADGQYMYVPKLLNGGVTSEIDIVDVTDPTLPVNVGNFSGTNGVSGYGCLTAIVDQKNNILASNGLSLSPVTSNYYLWDISTPTSPVFLTSITSTTILYAGWIYSRDSKYAYNTIADINTGASTLQIRDNSTPSNPSVISSINLANFIGHVGGYGNSTTRIVESYDGKTIYVFGVDMANNNDTRLVIIDVTDKTSPSIISNTNIPESQGAQTYSAILYNSNTIVVSTENGYSIVDLNNPVIPIVTNYDLTSTVPDFKFGTGLNLTLDGQYYALAFDRIDAGVNHPSILFIDPTNNTVVSRIDMSGGANSADYLNIGTGANGQDQVCLSVLDPCNFTVVTNDASSCKSSDGSIVITGDALLPNTPYDISYVSLSDTGFSAVGPITLNTNAAGELIIDNLSPGMIGNILIPSICSSNVEDSQDFRSIFSIYPICSFSKCEALSFENDNSGSSFTYNSGTFDSGLPINTEFEIINSNEYLASYNINLPCPVDSQHFYFEIDLTTQLISPPIDPFGFNSLFVYMTTSSGNNWGSNYQSEYGLTQVITTNPWIPPNGNSINYQPAAPFMAAAINEGTHTIRFRPYSLASPSQFHLQLSQFTDGGADATGQTWSVSISDIRICYDSLKVVGDTQTVACYSTDIATMNGTDTVSGTWSIGTGSAGTATITSPNSPTTTVTDFSSPGIYNMVWTNTNGCVQQTAIIANNICCNVQLSCPPSVTLQCTESLTPNITGLPDTSGSGCPVTLTYTDGAMTGGCNPNTGTFTRTYKAALTANPSIYQECQQAITVVDSVPPLFSPVNGDIYKIATPEFHNADSSLYDYLNNLTSGANYVWLQGVENTLGRDAGQISDVIPGSSANVLMRAATYPIFMPPCTNSTADIDVAFNFQFTSDNNPPGTGDGIAYAFIIAYDKATQTYNFDINNEISQIPVIEGQPYTLHLKRSNLPYSTSYIVCFAAATLSSDGTNYRDYDYNYSVDHFNVYFDETNCQKDTIYVSCPSDISTDGGISATDECGTNSINYSETIGGTQPCDYTLIKTWTATDACGNTNQFIKPYVIKDNIPPMFSTVQGNIYQKARPDFIVPSDNGLSDYLTSVVGSTSVVLYGSAEGVLGPDPGRITDYVPGSSAAVLYRLSTFPIIPDCDDEKISIDAVINVNYSYLNPPRDLYNYNNYFAYAFIVGNDGSTYNIDFSTFVGLPLNTIPNTNYKLHFVANDFPYNPTVEYTFCIMGATIYEGSSDLVNFECNYSFDRFDLIVDKSACPKDTSYVSCASDIPSDPSLSATDNCSTATVDMAETSSGTEPCDYTLTRTWTATDDCGNGNEYSHTYIVLDEIAPVIDENNVAPNYNSSSTVPITDWLSTLNNWYYTPMVTEGQFGPTPGTPQDYGAPAGMTTMGIAAAYPVPVDCANSGQINIGSSVTFTLDAVESTNPSGNNMDASILIIGETAGAYSILGFDVHTFHGGVAGQQATVSVDAQNLPYHDNYYILVMGNTIEDTDEQHYTSNYNVNYISAYCVDTVALYCEEEIPDAADKTYTDNCGGTGTATVSDTRDPATGDNFTLTRVWTATDECGNTATTQVVYAVEVAAPCSPLPLNLLSFTVQKSGAVSLLNWNTANEVNTDKFIVQHSLDGRSFSEIGTVSANNIGSTVNKYGFTDLKPSNGVNYYRLRNMDKNGSYTYSPIRSVIFDTNYTFEVYPNPVNGNDQAIVTGSGFKVLYLYDNLGKLVKTYGDIDSGADSRMIRLKDLAPGFYYLKNDNSQIVRLVIN